MPSWLPTFALADAWTTESLQAAGMLHASVLEHDTVSLPVLIVISIKQAGPCARMQFTCSPPCGFSSNAGCLTMTLLCLYVCQAFFHTCHH